jgi:hypothetical protein
MELQLRDTSEDFRRQFVRPDPAVRDRNSAWALYATGSLGTVSLDPRRDAFLVLSDYMRRRSGRSVTANEVFVARSLKFRSSGKVVWSCRASLPRAVCLVRLHVRTPVPSGAARKPQVHGWVEFGNRVTPRLGFMNFEIFRPLVHQVADGRRAGWPRVAGQLGYPVAFVHVRTRLAPM